MASDMQLHLLTALLRRGRALDLASSVLTLAGLAIGLAPLFGAVAHPLSGCLAIVILVFGGIEKYWAQRVGIDAYLFEVLATQASSFDTQVQELDDALHQLGLSPKASHSRRAAERGQGALRQLRRQAACLMVQCLCVLAVCTALLWLDLPI